MGTCGGGWLAVELGPATEAICLPALPEELAVGDREGGASGALAAVLVREDLVFVLRELLNRPSGTTRSFRTGMSSTVPRLSTVACVKYAAKNREIRMGEGEESDALRCHLRLLFSFSFK